MDERIIIHAIIIDLYYKKIVYTLLYCILEMFKLIINNKMSFNYNCI